MITVRTRTLRFPSTPHIYKVRPSFGLFLDLDQGLDIWLWLDIAPTDSVNVGFLLSDEISFPSYRATTKQHYAVAFTKHL